MEKLFQKYRLPVFLTIVYSIIYLIIEAVGFKTIHHSSRIFDSHEKGKPLRLSYFDDISIFKSSDKKVLIGFTTDIWNVGQKKYKNFLSVSKMVRQIQKQKLPCVEIPLWEISQGPHFDDLQRLFETFWIPDMTSNDHFILQYDLVVIPDPVIAKYMVEAYYEKEAKVEKKKAYYNKLIKQPWGVIDSYPPKDRYEYERIKNLSKQRWIPKYPPLAVCGEDVFKKMKHHGKVEFFSHGVEDFVLHLPNELIPSKRVLLLRFRNRYETLVESLIIRGVNVTSAYPVTWSKKEWSPQEERLAREVDVVYFHEAHAVTEWANRLSKFKDKREVVAACHDIQVAQVAKSLGFKDVFYALKSDSNGLTKTVLEATEYLKNTVALRK